MLDYYNELEKRKISMKPATRTQKRKHNAGDEQKSIF
jgi:hypothetical protein